MVLHRSIETTRITGQGSIRPGPARLVGYHQPHSRGRKIGYYCEQWNSISVKMYRGSFDVGLATSFAIEAARPSERCGRGPCPYQSQTMEGLPGAVRVLVLAHGNPG